MAGILSKPPALTRVSAGVYRDAKGNLVKSTTGKLPAAKTTTATKTATTTPTATPAAPAPQKLANLTAQQNQAVNQRQDADLSLGGAANAMLPKVQEAYSQPFNWDALPSQVVTGDYNNWVNQQMGNYNQAFDQRMNPLFQQQSTDFDQQMANRGIPVGSELYNNQKALMMQSQNDARTQAYAQNQGQAVNSAAQLFGIGTQARGNALNEGMQARNMPLTEFNALYGSTSPMAMQNLGYSQQFALQNDQQKAQMQLMKATPRGGGGGGGQPPAWQQYGFSGPMEYDAYQDARAINRQNAAGGGNSGPSYSSQLIGTGLGIIGASMF